jgi:hypothetical protein
VFPFPFFCHVAISGWITPRVKIEEIREKLDVTRTCLIALKALQRARILLLPDLGWTFGTKGDPVTPTHFVRTCSVGVRDAPEDPECR